MRRVSDLLSELLDATVALLRTTGLVRDHREPLLIVLEGGRFQLYRAGSGIPQLKIEGDLEKIGDATLPHQARSARTEIRIDARDCVTKVIHLPRPSRKFADSILRHQIERLTPWTLDSVAYDWSETGSTPEEFELRIVAAARSRIRADTDRLEQAGLHPGRVGITSDPIDLRSPIDLLGKGREDARTRLRRTAAACLILLGSVAIAACIGSELYFRTLAGKTGALQSRIDLLTAQIATEAAGRPLADGVIGRKLATPPMVLILDRLSAAVPSNTWLTELQLLDGQLAMTGMSDEAASLVGVLEAADFLADVRLSSATANDPLSGKERFSIEARLEEVSR